MVTKTEPRTGSGGVLKRLLVGRAMSSHGLEHTLLPKALALPVFASDALSSVAYATGEDLSVVGRNEGASLADWKLLADSGLVESTGAREVDLRFRGNPVLRGIPKSTGGSNGQTR